MNGIPDIRQLYHPVQPTVSLKNGEVNYTELMPGAELRAFIYCYWQLKTQSKLTEAFQYRVVADGCIDIFFELNRSHKNFVMGTASSYIEFPLDTTFNYVGVRFLPTAFPQLFKVNASELTDRFEALESVLPETSSFISNHFHEGLLPSEIKSLWDGYFTGHLSKTTLYSDKRLYKALEIILKNKGLVHLEQSLDIGLSSRQLRRLFEFYVGDSAKTFSKIVRFQNILKDNPSAESLRKNKIFYDAGYYDQAHFIKEFKTLYGETPSKALE